MSSCTIPSGHSWNWEIKKVKYEDMYMGHGYLVFTDDQLNLEGKV